jgi:tRNA threonylcarbamoyladenosine biosynthesis protein TsaE
MELVTGPPDRPVVLARPGIKGLALVTTSAEQTRELAGAVARLCAPGDVLLLAGGLGAGKTTFAQGFGAALGIAEPITSPTFVLVRQYPLGGTTPVRVLLHADVYRLDHLHEIVDLGLGELVDDAGVALVEWGDAAEPVLGTGALLVRLELAENDDSRAVTVSPLDGAWDDRWDRLAEALGSWRADR